MPDKHGKTPKTGPVAITRIYIWTRYSGEPPNILKTRREVVYEFQCRKDGTSALLGKEAITAHLKRRLGLLNGTTPQVRPIQRSSFLIPIAVKRRYEGASNEDYLRLELERVIARLKPCLAADLGQPLKPSLTNAHPFDHNSDWWIISTWPEGAAEPPAQNKKEPLQPKKA